MSLPFEICILRPADIPLMRGMLQLFANVFEEPETYLGHQPNDAYLTGLLGKAHVVAVCAVKDEAVIGGLFAYELDKFEQNRREIFIYDLAVDARFRRRGVATAMFDALKQEAIRRNVYAIFVQADVYDAPAIALYEKLGVKQPALHFDIDPRRE